LHCAWRRAFAAGNTGAADAAPAADKKGEKSARREKNSGVAPLSADELVQDLPHITAAVRQQAEARALEPFPGYARGLAQSVMDRGTGPVFRELPLQERLMERLPHRCPLCSSHPITGILPHVNALAETNVELLVKFVDSRGMIMARKRTGVCAKHQRKLAQVIKRARHLGFLSFTRGPDDLNNVGPPDFHEHWREHGDLYSPVHRQSDMDQAINQSFNADPRLDENGQVRQPWQLPTPGQRQEALPEEPQQRMAAPFTPVNEHQAKYRPATFHVTHQLMAAYKPVEAVSISTKNGTTLTIKNQPPLPEFAEPTEDPIEKFGPGEHYAHEAEFFGRRAPAMTKSELNHDAVIRAAIQRAKERKAAGQTAAAPAPPSNWALRIMQENMKLELALKVDRVLKEDKQSADGIDFGSIVAEVQQNLMADAQDPTVKARAKLDEDFEKTRYATPAKQSVHNL
jgi:ribosomal protein S18